MTKAALQIIESVEPVFFAAFDGDVKRKLEFRKFIPARVFCSLAEIDEELVLRVTDAIRTAREHVDGDSSCDCLVFAGTPGAGKTFAACWVAYSRLAMWGSGRMFVTAADLEAMKRDDRREFIAECELLILDDLGAEHGTGAWLADVDALIDTFYRECRKLLITTNLTAAQIEERYGGRVADRLAEYAKWIPCIGPSLRRRKP